MKMRISVGILLVLFAVAAAGAMPIDLGHGQIPLETTQGSSFGGDQQRKIASEKVDEGQTKLASNEQEREMFKNSLANQRQARKKKKIENDDDDSEMSSPTSVLDPPRNENAGKTSPPKFIGQKQGVQYKKAILAAHALDLSCKASGYPVVSLYFIAHQLN